MNLSRKLWLLIGFFTLLTTAIGGFSFYESQTILKELEYSNSVNLPRLHNATLVEMAHDGLHSNIYRAFFYSRLNNIKQVEKLKKENLDLVGNMKSYFQTLVKANDDPEIGGLLKGAENEFIDYADSSMAAIDLIASEKVAEAEANFPKFLVKYENVDRKLSAIVSLIEKKSHLQTAEGSKAMATQALFTVVGVLLGGVLGFLTVLQLNRVLRSFMKEIQDTSIKVQTISDKLSTSNGQLSSNATETASSLEETVASLEELSSMISLNTENSKKAFEVSEEIQSVAKKGEEDIKLLTTAMSSIKSDSKRMEEVVNVIDDISFQTNLLALNAAVEAARAGDQGKGFAVVADAVRSLAQRSSASAKEINQMIKENLNKVERGHLIANQCATSLDKIFQHIKQMTELNGQISQASQEQTTGLRQINQAMSQLDAASQENALAAESVAAGSTESQVQSKIMIGSIEELNSVFFGGGLKDVPSKKNEASHSSSSTRKKGTEPSFAEIERSVEAKSRPIATEANNVVPLKKTEKLKISLTKNKPVANKSPNRGDFDLGEMPTSNEIKKIENF